MAEAALFSIAAKVLSTISSPAFEKAYERARSIWGANDELEELKETITSIQAVLLDAERKHNDSSGVKNWIRRVRDVLYDAEDLFDVVATDDLLKQQMKGKKHLKSVRVFFSKLNPIASRDFISRKVKDIREALRGIYQDMALLGFVNCESENLSVSGFRRGVETGSFVDPDDIIGRDDEKKRVVDFVYNEEYAGRNISLISIVGFGGIGKSALAQLVFNDPKIRGDFIHRYWACISDISNEKEVLGKINQSMTDQGKYQELSLDQLQSRIRKSMHENGKFLLVLDNLWDEDAGRGSKLWSILSSDHAKGSKIIVTTRNLSVARAAMRADVVLELQDLSWDASWALFKRYAFTTDQENDPSWISIGEKIARKCSNVPLAIKIIASLLRIKTTIGEWRSLENEQLSKIHHGDNSIMSTLRLSYNHLPSHLKNCFASCSLYPKGSVLEKKKLIYLWIAQGHIAPKDGETLEMAGHACFMELFRRCFFQRAKYDDDEEMEITSFKMHDLIHDLAEDVAGQESCIITTTIGKNQSYNKIRHLRVHCHNNPSDIDIRMSLLDAHRLRTFLYSPANYSNVQPFDEQVAKFKFLRDLSLGNQGIRDIPSSIGEMKYLRCLDLSYNYFTHLPDSITKLVNLITLDVSGCESLLSLPRDMGELLGLRHLINRDCCVLQCLPPTLWKLTSLEHLSTFIVGEELCGLTALGRLNLHGSLLISFDRGVNWSSDKVLLEHGHIPHTLEELCITDYPSMRIPAWWIDINQASGLYKLERLSISNSLHVKHLPPLRCLPCLKSLHLCQLPNLEFIEDNEVMAATPFFPSLCTLKIDRMDNLKGWSATPNALMFPRLKSMKLSHIRAEVFEQLVSGPCSSSVENIVIKSCPDLKSFSSQGLTSLCSLTITDCEILHKVKVSSVTIDKLSISRCPMFELWEQTDDPEICVNWDSFANNRLVGIEKGQEGSSNLPDWLKPQVVLRFETIGTVEEDSRREAERIADICKQV